MAENGQKHFYLELFPKARERLRQLAERAATRNLRLELAAALKVSVQKLESFPVSWGEPLHHTHQGGVVYRAIHWQLLVRFVVLEAQHLVWLLDVVPLSANPLAEE
jgi:hypothetical protein